MHISVVFAMILCNNSTWGFSVKANVRNHRVADIYAHGRSQLPPQIVGCRGFYIQSMA
jgi:hypothetical protein